MALRLNASGPETSITQVMNLDGFQQHVLDPHMISTRLEICRMSLANDGNVQKVVLLNASVMVHAVVRKALAAGGMGDVVPVVALAHPYSLATLHKLTSVHGMRAHGSTLSRAGEHEVGPNGLLEVGVDTIGKVHWQFKAEESTDIVFSVWSITVGGVRKLFELQTLSNCGRFLPKEPGLLWLRVHNRGEATTV